MANLTNTIVHLENSQADQVSWIEQDSEGARQIGHGSLAEAARAIQGRRLTLLVPGEEILTQQVNLPVRQAQRLRQAVPFALEERFAEDVDALHFALGKRHANGDIPVVVVRKSLLRSWQQQLVDAELRADRVVPDVLAVPLVDGEWSLLLSDSRALLRMGAVYGWVFAAQELAALVPRALADEAVASPTRLRIYDCRQAHTGDLEGLAAWGVECEFTRVAQPLEVLAEGLAQDAAINLLQGEFSPREQYGRLWRPWRMSAALLLVALLLQGGVWLQEYFQLKGEEQRLYAQIVDVYREAFPDARNIVNPKVQMERELIQIRGGGKASGFGALFVTAAPILAADQRAEVRSLRFQQGSLDVDLTLSDLAALDGLKQALLEQGLEVTIQTASAQGDKVEGRIQIREGRS